MKYYKYGHGKWQPVWKISFNMRGPKEILQEVAKKVAEQEVAKKVAERYGTGPSLFTNEELEMLFGSH